MNQEEQENTLKKKSKYLSGLPSSQSSLILI